MKNQKIENTTAITVALPDGFTPITVDMSRRTYLDADLNKSARALRASLKKADGSEYDQLYTIQQVVNSESWRADFRNPAEFIVEELTVKQSTAYALIQVSRYVKKYPDGKIHSVFYPYFEGTADFTAAQLRDVVRNKEIRENPELLISLIQSGVFTPATKRSDIESIVRKALAPAPIEASNSDSNKLETNADSETAAQASEKSEPAPVSQGRAVMDSLYDAVGKLATATDVIAKATEFYDYPDFVAMLAHLNESLEILREITGDYEKMINGEPRHPQDFEGI